jgi:hypothetical protein
MADNQQDEYWHVRIEVKGANPKKPDRLVVVDKNRAWVEDRILSPRRQGSPITVLGRHLEWSDITAVRISHSPQSATDIANMLKREDERSPVMVVGRPSYNWRAAIRAEDATDELIDSPVGTPSSASSASDRPAADPKKVMVVHGRDEVARRAMFDFLRALGLTPLEWGSLVAGTGKGAPLSGKCSITHLHRRRLL